MPHRMRCEECQIVGDHALDTLRFGIGVFVLPEAKAAFFQFTAARYGAGVADLS
jgi:hypothetical protein